MTKQKDGIWIIDADAKTVYASAAMAQILGTDASQMLGTSSFEYIFPEDLGAAQRLFNFKREGSSAPFHFKLRRKDGSSIWVDVQGTPMHNAAGEFIGIVGMFTVSS